jgi:hypothetical protein
MALQVVDAMAPFAGAGIIDMPKLANYVLQYGFGIKNAASFVMQPELPAQPIGPQGTPPPPEEMPMQGAPMPQEIPAGLPPQAMMEGMPPTGGMPMPSNIPPEILSQLLASGSPLPNTQLPPNLG